MAILYTATLTSINLVTEKELLSYDYHDDNNRAIEVVARVDLGDLTKPIAGGGMYTLHAYINDTIVLPSASIPVGAGLQRATLVSRPMPLNSGDNFKIKVVGRAGDTSVNTKVDLRDQTPISMSDVIGTGAVSVDHDYGVVDNLTVLDSISGAAIDNAIIQIFRKTDYDAGKRSREFTAGETTSDVNGQWTHPVLLDPGQYVILVYKQGIIRAKAVNLTVN